MEVTKSTGGNDSFRKGGKQSPMDLKKMENMDRSQVIDLMVRNP